MDWLGYLWACCIIAAPLVAIGLVVQAIIWALGIQ